MEDFCVLGVDLAGVPHSPTGMCLLKGFQAKTFLCYSDREIMEYTENVNPELVAIDAPLTLPPERKSIHERKGQHFRLCDLELRRRKIPFFPITLGPMRKLTERGVKLKSELARKGLRAVEIYPGGAQDIWGIPRAKRNLSALRQGLQSLGLQGIGKDISGHELDAATGALVGLLFLQGKAEVYGDFTEGAIIMPSQSK